MRSSTEQTVRKYIEDSFLGEAEAGNVGRDDDLLMVLDSLQVLRMLLDLEAEYSIKVDHGEMTAENLGTIARLAGFIERKRQGAVC